MSVAQTMRKSPAHNNFSTVRKNLPKTPFTNSIHISNVSTNNIFSKRGFVGTANSMHAS